MDASLIMVLVGTAIVSIGTVIYVLVDEQSRRESYGRQPQPPEEPVSPAPSISHVAAAPDPVVDSLPNPSEPVMTASNEAAELSD